MEQNFFFVSGHGVCWTVSDRETYLEAKAQGFVLMLKRERGDSYVVTLTDGVHTILGGGTRQGLVPALAFGMDCADRIVAWNNENGPISTDGPSSTVSFSQVREN